MEWGGLWRSTIHPTEGGCILKPPSPGRMAGRCGGPFAMFPARSAGTGRIKANLTVGQANEPTSPSPPLHPVREESANRAVTAPRRRGLRITIAVRKRGIGQGESRTRIGSAFCSLILNREALEPALIHMPLPSGSVMGMVAHGVGQGHPAEEVAHSPILGWLQYEVPVIRHKLTAQNKARVTLHPLGENPRERFIVFRFAKDLAPSVPAIQGMVDPTCFISALWSGHSAILNASPQQEKSPYTFSVSSHLFSLTSVSFVRKKAEESSRDPAVPTPASVPTFRDLSLWLRPEKPEPRPGHTRVLPAAAPHPPAAACDLVGSICLV